MSEIICCGKPIEKSRSKTTQVFTLACMSCGRMGAGKTAEEAETAFRTWEGGSLPIPVNPSQLPAFAASRMKELAAVAAPFISNDRPALARLVQNDVRYIMKQKSKAWDEVWKTKEGQESVVVALEEALGFACELGKMGSVVPFGTVVEFIPGVETYEFALTAGTQPSFQWINIEPICEGDIRDIEVTNGRFSCKIKPAVPPGELEAMVVYGHNNRLGYVIGQIYGVDRLLKKAEEHSSSYRLYLRQVRAAKRARTEDRLHVDAEGREYADVIMEDGTAGKYHEQDVENFEKAEKEKTLKKDSRGDYAEAELPKKGGGTWKKKIYRSSIENPGTTTKRLYLDEISNPYDGGDRIEMLRKSAGKSFLGKYARVRNAEAAIQESSGDEAEDVVDATIDAAFAAYDTTPEPEPTSEPEPAKPDPVEPDPVEDEVANMSQEELDKAIAAEQDEPGADLMGKVKKKVNTRRADQPPLESYE